MWSSNTSHSHLDGSAMKKTRYCQSCRQELKIHAEYILRYEYGQQIYATPLCTTHTNKTLNLLRKDYNIIAEADKIGPPVPMLWA